MEQTEKERKINKLISEYLPGIRLDAIRSGSDKEVHGAYYAVSNKYKDLNGSQYYYQAGKKFVHFTSLLALESIVQSRNIRLYNLHNLNDPREYSFSAKIFDYNNKNSGDAKLNMFLLSLCKTDIFKRPVQEEFFMWKLYGHDGYGVGIEFDFNHCQPDEWRDFYLSQIFYGGGSRSKLNQLAKILSSLENEKPNCILDLGQLMCFHKSNLYKLETEVRLLYDMRQSKSFLETQYGNMNKQVPLPHLRNDITKSLQNKKEIKFLELPIYYKECIMTSSFPIPMITKITLGYQYYKWQDIAKKIKKMIQDYLEYEVTVVPTKLATIYNDIKDSTT
jgi:hypothetical protein